MEGGYFTMSRQIDERVVSMKFDNQQFEKNVKTTMGTLDKLKEKLNIQGASKGLENVSHVAKKVDLSGVSAGVDALKTKFSALEVMGVTALVNITNSAVNAGKRITKALTLDPVKTGFSEYETKINAVQTIMSNTASKGKTMDDITKVLNELNVYADKTIYNFAEMTKNIGTFTAAGIDLEESASAIQGIANLAATSGSTSQQASTAMYQLSQALASGTVKLMDWNSVVNAGMGGQKFQDALKTTAREHGIAVDKIIEKQGSFRESLQEGWISADILNETLNKFTVDGAKKYAQAMLESGKYTEAQANALVKEAQDMEDAATKVKTFTQLWSTLQESAQSGWAQTWELVVGDFEEAKEFLTYLSDTFGDILNKSADKRNNLLKNALGSNWDKFISKVNEAGVETETFLEVLKKTAKENKIPIDELIKKHKTLQGVIKAGKIPSDIFSKALKKLAGVEDEASKSTDKVKGKVENLEKVVSRVIKGDFGNGAARVKALTKAGYDYATVQGLVNKVLKGEKVNFEQLSKAQLENLGYTKEQIAALKALSSEAETSGKPLSELIAEMDKPSGRELLIDSVKNSLEGLLNICKNVGKAWDDAISKMDSDELYDVVVTLNEFSKKLKENGDTCDKVYRTFRGLFAVLDLVSSVAGGAFKIALKVICKLLGIADDTVLSMTASLGDMLFAFSKWVKENEYIAKTFDVIATVLATSLQLIGRWIKAFIDLPIVQKNVERFKKSFLSVANLGKDLIDGIINGIHDGTLTVTGALMTLGEIILTTIKNVLGIHSPSKKTYEMGVNTTQGFANGIQNGLSSVVSICKAFGQKVIDTLSGFNWGAILTVAFGIAAFKTFNDVTKVLDKFAGPFEGVGKVLKSVAGLLNTLKGTLKDFSLSLKAKAIQDIAIAVAILAGSLVVLSLVKPERLGGAVLALAAIAVLLGGLSAAMARWGPKDTLNFAGLSLMLVGISISMLLMASAIKKMAAIKPEDIGTLVGGMTMAIGGFIAILWALNKFVNTGIAWNAAETGFLLIQITIALLLMAHVVKMVGALDVATLLKGAGFIVGFILFVGALADISTIGGNGIDKLGATLLQFAASLLIMVFVIKIISGMHESDLLKGLAVIVGLGLIMVGLMWATNLIEKEINEIGKTLLAMAASMLILVIVIKMIAGMEWSELGKGITGVALLGAVIAGLVYITKLFDPKDLAGLSKTLIGMSVSIALIAVIATLLSLVPLSGLIKGIAAVGALALIMAGLMYASKFMKAAPKTILNMGIALALIAGSVAILSFIEPSKLAGAVAAMGVLMIVFGVMAKLAGTVSASIGPLIVMTVAVGMIGGMLYLLGQLDPKKALAAATAISLVLLAMSASLFIVSSMGAMTTMGLVTIGVMTLVVLGLAGILKLMSDLNIKDAMVNAQALSTLLLSLSAAVAILALSGLGGPAALIGIGSLLALITSVGVLAGVIGALVTKFPMLEEFVNKGGAIIGKIGTIIGTFFGNIISGFATGAMQMIPALGLALSMFMVNVTPFIMGAKMIDESITSGIKSLAAAVLILTGASLLESITKFLGDGESPLVKFGKELNEFAPYFVSFADKVKGIDPTTVTAASNAILALAKAADKIPNSGGWLSAIVGENSISSFGMELVGLGTNLKNFVTNLGTFSKEQVSTAKAAADVIVALAEAADKIPNSGGWLAAIVGDNSIGAFGLELVGLGTNLKNFVTNLGTFDKGQITTVEAAGKAIVALAKAADEIPNSGGWLADIVGDNDIGDFGDKLPDLGTNIKDFGTNLGTFGPDQIATIDSASKAIVALAKASKSIPEEGWAAKLTGKTDMDVFSKNIPKLGTAIKKFATNVNGIRVECLDAATKILKAIVSLAKLDIATAGINLKDFGKHLVDFAKKLGKFEDKMKDVSGKSIDSAISKSNKLVVFAASLSSANLESVKAFGNALSKFAKDGVKGFVSALESKTGKADAKSALGSLLNACVSKVKNASSYTKFRNAGKYLVDGFAAGIKANSYKAEAKAAAMAEDAYKAAKKKLDVNSPSKVFRKLGYTVPEGFAMGIDRMANMASKSSVAMADSAIDSLKGSISRIATIAETDIDSQPTIRPVLDLSDVSAGANAIGSMLNMSPSIGVMSNLGAINSMMSTNQNGGNDDVVSAIKDLNKSIGNMSGNVYNVNGVTYDDGSNIANAVQSIARAALRERRI